MLQHVVETRLWKGSGDAFRGAQKLGTEEKGFEEGVEREVGQDTGAQRWNRGESEESACMGLKLKPTAIYLTLTLTEQQFKQHFASWNTFMLDYFLVHIRSKGGWNKAAEPPPEVKVPLSHVSVSIIIP